MGAGIPVGIVLAAVLVMAAKPAVVKAGHGIKKAGCAIVHVVKKL